MRLLCLSLSLVAALVFPVAAGAKTVPPGNSGADQYAETLPGAGGNHPTSSGRAGGAGSPNALSSATQRSLDQLGPAGRATAALANRTAESGGKAKSGAASKNTAGSSGFLAGLKQAGGNTDSGGMGIALPLILAGSVLAALAVLRARRRRAGEVGDTEGTG